MGVLVYCLKYYVEMMEAEYNYYLGALSNNYTPPSSPLLLTPIIYPSSSPPKIDRNRLNMTFTLHTARGNTTSPQPQVR
jgi:hypothetical protein